MEYLCLLREWLYVKWIYAFHEKGFQYECLVSLEKCEDGKDIDALWGCSICNMYDIWKYERYRG